MVGDITAYAERVLAAAGQDDGWLNVVEAEAEGDLLHMTLSTSSESNDVSNFYSTMSENLGPGVPL